MLDVVYLLLWFWYNFFWGVLLFIWKIYGKLGDWVKIMVELKNIYVRKRVGDSFYMCFYVYIIMCMYEGKMRFFFLGFLGRSR